MPVSNIMRIGYLKYILFAMAFAVSACSIKQSLEECPPGPEPPVDENITQLLYVRIADVLTGDDITATEELDDIMVYLFDSEEMLVDTIPYTMSMIRSGIPVDLTGRNLDGGYVSVWANLSNTVHVTPAVFGMDIDDLSVSMLENNERADFYDCPGDMFFGYEQIRFTPVDEDIEADTVMVMRKNARLNITVRGLPETADPDDYYFNMRILYSGYDYTGEPEYITREIWEFGAFADDDFISPEPYWMVHHPEDMIYDENNMVEIDLYQAGSTSADNLLARATTDVNGEYIKLTRGMTTNVLIVVYPTGDITVQIAITPWDEIHQWTIW